MIDQQKFIIKLFAKWYTVSTNPGQNIRRVILQNASVVFNISTNEMIKNRYEQADITPAIRLKLWLGNEIQEFKWPGDEAFEDQYRSFYRSY